MSSSKRRKVKGQGELMTPSILLDVIDQGLKIMSQTWPQKELTPEEIENWHRDLGVFPKGTIEYAFDNWRRNGRYFPVYGDILDLCVAFQPPELQPVCDVACKRRHGRGYGENPARGLHDVIMLNELVRRKIEREKRTAAQPLTDAEIEGLLDELDKMRGRKPQWREIA